MASTKHVSHSELSDARQCRLKHHLGYVELWRPPTVSEALSRGTLFHTVMEKHYRALQQRLADAEPFENALYLHEQVKPFLYDENGRQTEEQELVEWIYRGYVEMYKLDPDWEILDVEFKIAEWLPTERGTRSSVMMHGTVDLLVRDHGAGGGLWIVDHKTCRNLPKQRDIDLDDQMGIYIYLLRRRGLDIRGAIYNACRSQKLVREMDLKERFLRKHSVRTDQELEVVTLEALDEMRDTYRPHPHRDLPPRRPDPDRCGWKCPFTEPCLASRRGMDIRTLLPELGFEVGEPRYGPGSERVDERGDNGAHDQR